METVKIAAVEVKINPPKVHQITPDNPIFAMLQPPQSPAAIIN